MSLRVRLPLSLALADASVALQRCGGDVYSLIGGGQGSILGQVGPR